MLVFPFLTNKTNQTNSTKQLIAICRLTFSLVEKIVDYILIKRYGISLEKEGTMKYRNVALFFVIASLFLNFLPHRAATASGGTTAILTFSHIPTGG